MARRKTRRRNPGEYLTPEQLVEVGDAFMIIARRKPSKHDQCRCIAEGFYAIAGEGLKADSSMIGIMLQECL
jgi:hypothetical protein